MVLVFAGEDFEGGRAWPRPLCCWNIHSSNSDQGITWRDTVFHSDVLVWDVAEHWDF